MKATMKWGRRLRLGADLIATVLSHLTRHSGPLPTIALGISGVAIPPSVLAPAITRLMAESDLFGPLAPEEQALLAEHFVAVVRERGETLMREGEIPETMFLLAAGTVELTRREGAGKRVLLRASPGDSVGMISLITGNAPLTTATALTRVAAYSLDKADIARVLPDHPGLVASLEAQARRGLAWSSCEAAAHEDDEVQRPEMLLARLRQSRRRLNI